MPGAGIARANNIILHLSRPNRPTWEKSRRARRAEKVCEFWADRGVDGLRLDVVNLIAKDQGFSDDPTGDGRRFYTDGPRAHTFTRK